LNELKKYVLKGGVVLCDAAGEQRVRAPRLRDQLDNIITGSKLEPIPAGRSGRWQRQRPDAEAPPMNHVSTPIVPTGESPMASRRHRRHPPAGDPDLSRSLFPPAPPAATQPATTRWQAPKVNADRAISRRVSQLRAGRRMGAAENLRLKDSSSARSGRDLLR